MDDIEVNGTLAWMSMGTSIWCDVKTTSMLAMDDTSEHISDRIRNRLRKRNADLVIIPNDVTYQLQPLYVSINKPFKHLVRKRYDETWLN
jgi:hypothetical protein